MLLPGTFMLLGCFNTGEQTIVCLFKAGALVSTVSTQLGLNFAHMRVDIE